MSKAKKAPAKPAKPSAKDLAHISPDLRGLATPIDEVHLDPKNANDHDAVSIDAIAASLADAGQLKPIVANRREGGRIVAGNGTYEAGTARLGWKYLAVNWIDVTPEKATRFALADNRTAEFARWDESMLAELLEEIGQADGKPDPLLDALLFDELIDPPAAAPSAEGDGDGDADYGGATSISRASAPMAFWKKKKLLVPPVLDFGSGKDPHDFARYDAFHAPDPAPLRRTWRTITCNYVFNVQPADHLVTQLSALLYWLLDRPDGRLLLAVRNDIPEGRQKSGRGVQTIKTDDQWRALLDPFFEVELVHEKDFFGYVATPREPPR